MNKNPMADEEFNRLKITNLESYLSTYVNSTVQHTPPFRILADLEDRVKNRNVPEQRISIPYKSAAMLCFDLIGIDEEVNPRVVEYRFDNLDFAVSYN